MGSGGCRTPEKSGDVRVLGVRFIKYNLTQDADDKMKHYQAGSASTKTIFYIGLSIILDPPGSLIS